MKVFLSHPMHGLNEKQVFKIRHEAIEYLRSKYGQTADIRAIDNYTHGNAPYQAGRLWHLGRSIQQMEEADAIYFCEGWSEAKGCQIERTVAYTYGLKILT